jgi:hypothetical protein
MDTISSERNGAGRQLFKNYYSLQILKSSLPSDGRWHVLCSSILQRSAGFGEPSNELQNSVPDTIRA